MTKLIYVHGWGGNPTSEPWTNYLRSECEKKGVEFIAPEMPDTQRPVIEKWIAKLKEVADGKIGEDTYLVGHSIGCQTIMRYLEKASDDLIVKGIVFVAPWISLVGLEEEEGSKEIAKPWLETPIDFEKVKGKINELLAIFSTDDPYVPLSNMKLFERKLDAEIVVKNNEGHFNETESINEIMEFVEK